MRKQTITIFFYGILTFFYFELLISWIAGLPLIMEKAPCTWLLDPIAFILLFIIGIFKFIEDLKEI